MFGWSSDCGASLWRSTLKGVEDGEDVVGRYEQWPVAEKSKGPGDAEEDKQAQDGKKISLSWDVVLNFPCCRLKGNHQPHSYDEYAKGEDEYYGIITNVHPLLDNGIRDPAPENQKKKKKKLTALQSISLIWDF